MSLDGQPEHFSKLASEYRRVRTTDIDPIAFIKQATKDYREIKAADIGCGAGRYDLLLFRYLNNLDLTCVDANKSMLEQVSHYLSEHGISNFHTLKADANSFSLEPASLNCVFTFNAVHHFNFTRFLTSVSAALEPNGRIFIYTRTRSQNARNIWGRFFPKFSETETRLFELEEMKDWVTACPSVELETVQEFRHKRQSNLQELVDKVKAGHYSTFALYDENTLATSTQVFQENIRESFPDTDRVVWEDENIMLVLRRN